MVLFFQHNEDEKGHLALMVIQKYPLGSCCRERYQGSIEGGKSGMMSVIAN
jgi:hypothetical protein